MKLIKLFLLASLILLFFIVLDLRRVITIIIHYHYDYVIIIIHYKIVEDVCDAGSLLGFKSFFGSGVHCLFGKLDGLKVGFLAAQGHIDGKGALKASNFVQICEQVIRNQIFIIC